MCCLVAYFFLDLLTFLHANREDDLGGNMLCCDHVSLETNNNGVRKEEKLKKGRVKKTLCKILVAL